MTAAARVCSDIDPFAPAFREDPFPFYAQLRAIGPIIWLPQHEMWVVTRYDAVTNVLRDWERFSNAGGGGLPNLFKQANWRPPSIILEVDPPEHARTRRVLSRVFTPAAVRGMRPGFERVAAMLVDRALEQGEIDAVPDLVEPFPLTVFPDAVGMPPLDRERLLAYGRIVFATFGPPSPELDARIAQARELSDWIDAQCAREALGADGLGAAIHAAADDGEITPREATLLVRSLLSAGVDTTIDAIGLALRCLAGHPDQWALLRDDPALAANAFEEVTRYDSSGQSIFRTTLCELDFHGARLGKHEKVMVLLGAASRDPARWAEPDRFDIRRRVSHQISFGAGIHGCVAQMMARLEGEVLLTALAQRVQHIVPAGPARMRLAAGTRGLESLPLRITAKGSV